MNQDFTLGGNVPRSQSLPAPQMAQVSTNVLALEYLTSSGDPTKAFEKLYVSLPEAHREILQQHMLNEALKFQQQQQQQHQPLLQNSFGSLSFQDLQAQQNQMHMHLQQLQQRQQQQLFSHQVNQSSPPHDPSLVRSSSNASIFFSGIVPSDAPVDCIDELFAVSFQSRARSSSVASTASIDLVQLPMSQRQLPKSFFIPPNSGLTPSESDCDSSLSESSPHRSQDALHSPNNISAAPASNASISPLSPKTALIMSRRAKIQRRSSGGSDAKRPRSPTAPYKLRVDPAAYLLKNNRQKSVSTPNMTNIPVGARLPPGWRASSTDDGLVFYVNDELGQSSWVDPRMLLPQTPPKSQPQSQLMTPRRIPSAQSADDTTDTVLDTSLPHPDLMGSIDNYFPMIDDHNGASGMFPDSDDLLPFTSPMAQRLMPMMHSTPPRALHRTPMRGSSLNEHDLNYFRTSKFVSPMRREQLGHLNHPFNPSMIEMESEYEMHPSGDHDLDVFLQTLRE